MPSMLNRMASSVLCGTIGMQQQLDRIPTIWLAPSQARFDANLSIVAA